MRRGIIMVEFYSKIVGTTFCNGQEELKSLSEGESLIIHKEDNNPYDENAIAIYTDYMVKLGYIPRDTAKNLREQVEDWSDVSTEVSEITGGKGDKTNRGCNIKITIND